VISERERKLKERDEQDGEILLDEQFERQVPANAFYFIGMIIACFLITMLILVVVAG
jgi:hypothetical protein